MAARATLPGIVAKTPCRGIEPDAPFIETLSRALR